MADIHIDSDSKIVSLTDGSEGSWMDDVDSAKNGQTPPNQEDNVARSKGEARNERDSSRLRSLNRPRCKTPVQVNC